MANPVPAPITKLLKTFERAASGIPAYATILKENGISPKDIKTIQDFQKLPILDKHKTFQRFAMHELRVGGELGPISWVLTSSGQSGIFSFGLYDPPGAEDYKKRIDDALDAIFQVQSRKSLLLNCLPMGVKLFSEYCTLGEVSIRADMACALMKAFGRYYEQVILVGETAFIKHLLEMGVEKGIDWKTPLVHIILGEELVAENARRYLESLLGTTVGNIQTGLVAASMGVGELGLNLFFEVPPAAPLVKLRRALQDNRPLRDVVLGPGDTTVPAFFSYDPDRIYVEFVNGKLVITTLDPTKPIPMVRYNSDDDGGFLQIPDKAWPTLQAAGIARSSLDQVPIVMIKGRGLSVLSGNTKVYPEEIKEGLYHDFKLAKLTTANFRMVPGSPAKIRIQLSPGIKPTTEITGGFIRAIANYTTCPLDITCEPFDSFKSGMNVDYEKKYDYLGS